MESETVLISTMDEESQELVEVPISVFDNENVVIDTGSYEVSSSMDLETQIIETTTLDLNDSQDETQQLQQHEQLYAVVCSDSMEEVAVEEDNNSVIEITVDDSECGIESNIDDNVVKLFVDQQTDEEGNQTIEEDNTYEIVDENVIDNTVDELMQDSDSNILEENDSNVLAEDNLIVLGEDQSHVLEEDHSNVLEEDHSNVLEEDNSNVLEDDNSNVLEEDNSNVLEEDHSNILEEDNSNILEDNSNVLEEDHSNVLEEGNSNILEEDNSNVLEEDHSNVLEEDNSNILEEDNSNILEEDNSNILEEDNSNVLEEVSSNVLEEDNSVMEVITSVEEEEPQRVEELIENDSECATVVSEIVNGISETQDTEIIQETSEEGICSENSEDLVSESVVNELHQSGNIRESIALSSSTSEGVEETVLNSTVADSSMVNSSSIETPVEQKSEDFWIIDTSKPIELKTDAVMWINSHKCIIQRHPEKCDELVAYPVRERYPKKNRRGRPRKLRPPSIVDDDEDELDDKMKSEEDEKAEKGFVQMSDSTGTVVKRSARKRKRASHLDEYETGMAGAASDNEEQSVAEDDDDFNKSDVSVGYTYRGRGRGRGRGRARTSIQISTPGRGTGRGRGRPRRYNIEPDKEEQNKVKVGKPQPQQQAYLVQMGDGRTVVIQVPVTGLAEGMTSQSLAMSVAEALSSGQSSGVLNISVQRGSGTTTIKKDTKVEAPKSVEAAATPATATTLTSQTTPAPSGAPTLIPLTVVPPKADPPASQLGVVPSEPEGEKFNCSKCDFESSDLQEQQEHFIAVHSDYLINCKCCSYVTLNNADEIKHYKNEHPSCVCNICNFTFDQPAELRKHTASRHSCVCHICKKTYKDNNILKSHMKMVHMPTEVSFECQTCKKKFNRKAHLVRHIRTHSPTKSFKCAQCDYSGTEKSDLLKHSLIHEEPKHSCEICGHLFRHIRNKEIHVKRHIRQKDYKCGVCDYAGYTFTDVKKHITRMHAEDPDTVVCFTCGQAFADEDQLTDHHDSGQCEAFIEEEALLAGEDLALEDSDIEMELADDQDNFVANGEASAMEMCEDTLSLVVNSSDLMGIKESEEVGEVISGDISNEMNCEPQTISLVSDGVEFDGSHGLLTLLSEDGQVIRGIILDSGEIETQMESAVVLEEVT